MGGQETLLLVGRYPRLFAGAAAFDAVSNFALQYRNFRRLSCGRGRAGGSGAARSALGSEARAHRGRRRAERGATGLGRAEPDHLCAPDRLLVRADPALVERRGSHRARPAPAIRQALPHDPAAEPGCADRGVRRLLDALARDAGRDAASPSRSRTSGCCRRHRSRSACTICRRSRRRGCAPVVQPSPSARWSAATCSSRTRTRPRARRRRRWRMDALGRFARGGCLAAEQLRIPLLLLARTPRKPLDEVALDQRLERAMNIVERAERVEALERPSARRSLRPAQHEDSKQRRLRRQQVECLVEELAVLRRAAAGPLAGRAQPLRARRSSAARTVGSS